MIRLSVVLFILFVHFVGDFVAQTNSMATRKSKSFKWLSVHVLVYAIITAICWDLFLGVGDAALCFVMTFLSHLIIDFITSKITRYYFNRKEYHKFFMIVGIDQFAHFTTLFLTYTIIN
jgi:hypothetical protein